MSDKSIVLITGANQGVGFEVAKILVLHSPSYHVLVASRDPSRGANAVATLQALPNIKGTAELLTLDVTSKDSIAAAVSQVSSTHGRLDTLVNNAGIALPGPSADSARTIFETNVVSYIAVSEAFLPLLRNSAAPRLVFVSSSLGSLTHASDPKSPYYRPEGMEYRAATAARNMIMNQYWVRLQQEEGKNWKVHGADPGLTVSNLTGDPDGLRARGAVEPEVGGERIACVVRGDRDADVGRVCGFYGVSPW
ncbi:putative short chain dehydrogenase/reductase [Mycena galericulata]|nr:putative short chain dehydrogenase/reductase [Mycena galericulata]